MPVDRLFLGLYRWSKWQSYDILPQGLSLRNILGTSEMEDGWVGIRQKTLSLALGCSWVLGGGRGKHTSSYWQCHHKYLFWQLLGWRIHPLLLYGFANTTIISSSTMFTGQALAAPVAVPRSGLQGLAWKFYSGQQHFLKVHGQARPATRSQAGRGYQI